MIQIRIVLVGGIPHQGHATILGSGTGSRIGFGFPAFVSSIGHGGSFGRFGGGGRVGRVIGVVRGVMAVAIRRGAGRSVVRIVGGIGGGGHGGGGVVVMVPGGGGLFVGPIAFAFTSVLAEARAGSGCLCCGLFIGFVLILVVVVDLLVVISVCLRGVLVICIRIRDLRIGDAVRSQSMGNIGQLGIAQIGTCIQIRIQVPVQVRIHIGIGIQARRPCFLLLRGQLTTIKVLGCR
mmetsp:Transcript_25989/g.53763  ORF Transcript_25989/g.53763 Transcript_25989/m.53763 type:complete len:235 (-) Transcript_25989:377-1081(-)